MAERSAPISAHDAGPEDSGPSTFSPADHALFDAYLRHGLSTPHLAAAANNPHLSTLDLLAWLDQPHIQHALQQLSRAHALAAKLRRAQARFTAIETLDTLCTTSPDPTERRRAATTLLAPASRKPARQEGLARASRATSRVRTVHAKSQSHPSDQSDPAALSDLLALSDLSESDDLDDLDNDPDDDFSDAALDRFAADFQQRLGVPITHPDILAAVAQGRVHDLDQIASAIRANAPP